MIAPRRALWRRRRFELANALGLAPRGWFIPYRYRAASPAPIAPYPEGAFAAAAPRMFETLCAAAAFRQEWARFSGRPPPPTPRFDQDWFPGLDAILLYGLVRALAPGRIVEIGSGHSTRFAAQALADAGVDARILAIDPAPRAAVEALAPRVELLRQPIQSAGAQPFETLGAGDFLLIDSSHVLMPGSDVDILLNRVLPLLPAGVVLHIHDIFLPDPYPADWEWRGYNEQNAVAALVAGGGYEILSAARYLETRHAAETVRIVGGSPPSPPGARPAGLWLRKLAPAINQL